MIRIYSFLDDMPLINYSDCEGEEEKQKVFFDVRKEQRRSAATHKHIHNQS
jgi:hypothetical protein